MKRGGGSRGKGEWRPERSGGRTGKPRGGRSDARRGEARGPRTEPRDRPRAFASSGPRRRFGAAHGFTDQAPAGAGSREPAAAAPRPKPEARARPAEPSERHLFGINPVLEALRANPERIERLYLADGTLGPRIAGEIYSRARDAGLRVDAVDRERLTQMAQGGVHQGVVAEVRTFQYLELFQLIERAKASDRPPFVVVLDGIQDPQNLGAIIRSAHAFGAHGVVLPKDRAAGITGFVAKASAGAVEHCDIARVTNLSRALEELKEAGFWIVVADPEGDRDLWDGKLEGPLAVVVGAEGPGVRKGVLEHCDFRVRIPMLGQVASLNASVSAAVLLYEVTRQRALVRKPAAEAS